MNKYVVLLLCAVTLPMYADVTITCPSSTNVTSSEVSSLLTFPWRWSALSSSFQGYGYSKFSDVGQFQGAVLAKTDNGYDVLCSYEGEGDSTAESDDGGGYTINDQGHTNCHFDGGATTFAVDAMYWQSQAQCGGEVSYSADNLGCNNSAAECYITCSD